MLIPTAGPRDRGDRWLSPSNFPALDLRTYKDGRPLENLTAAFPPTVSPALLEEETLGIVLGQDQRRCSAPPPLCGGTPTRNDYVFLNSVYVFVYFCTPVQQCRV